MCNLIIIHIIIHIHIITIIIKLEWAYELLDSLWNWKLEGP